MAQQKMANLHENRTTPSKPPFTLRRVDCFGLFEVRRGRTTVSKEQVLGDEDINTLMCEVEAIVNGRPITKLALQATLD